MIETREILYIVGFTLVMSGVIQSSNRLNVTVSDKTSFFSISNIGKMASFGIFINAFFVLSWWVPLITFFVAIPLGMLIYMSFEKFNLSYGPHIQVIMGMVISAISLSK